MSDQYETVAPPDAWANDADAALPDLTDIGEAWFNRIFVMPMSPPVKTKGGILLTDDYRHQQTYLGFISRIVAVGKKAFGSKRFQALGFDPRPIPEGGEMPTRGEWWLHDIYQMRRYEVKLSNGNVARLLILNEESLIQRIPEGKNPWDYRLVK